MQNLFRSPGTRIAVSVFFAVTVALTGCLTSTSSEKKPPVITGQPANVTVASGGNATFMVTATGALTYKWVRNNTDTLDEEVLPILVLMNVDPTLSGSTYKCVVGNIGGSVTSASATLTVTTGGDYVCTSSADTLCISRQALADSGEVLYHGYCTGCHSEGGMGTPLSTPPHANSDWFMNHKRLTMQIVLAGYSDSIFVNGLPYHGEMPSFDFFSDREVASILTYLRTVLNDSTVVSCGAYDPADTSTYDGNGFPYCQKMARSLAERNADTVAVWQVKLVRDSIAAHPAM